MQNKPQVETVETTSLAPATQQDVATMPSLEVEMFKMAITVEQIRKYIAPPDATSADIAFFLGMAKSLGLNPWAKEIYMIPFRGQTGRKYAGVVNYQVLLDRADASGVLDGMEIEFDDDDNPKKCTVTIYRKDWERPFKRTTLLKEVIRMKDGKPQALWRTRLRQMFEKCAVTAALRFAIPACRRMPYIEEELGGGIPQDRVESQAITAPTVETVEQVPSKEKEKSLYFSIAGKLFKDDDDRHQWQANTIGKESTKDWTADDFSKAYDLLLDSVLSDNTDPDVLDERLDEDEPEDEITMDAPDDIQTEPAQDDLPLE